MRKLILIRHGKVKISAETPPHQWPLAPDAEPDILALAEILRPYSLDALFTSTQPKAIATSEKLAAALEIELDDAMDEFDEHDRSANAPYLPDPADFEARMAQFFAEPSEIVFGMESAFDARGRFAGGIYDTQDESPNGNIAIVTHGTVMALFIARCIGAEPFNVWRDIQRLGMPCYAVLTLPDFQLLALSGVG